jgi:hypothetical protein
MEEQILTLAFRLAAIAWQEICQGLLQGHEGGQVMARTPSMHAPRVTFILREASFQPPAGGSTPNGDITTNSNDYHLYYNPLPLAYQVR